MGHSTVVKENSFLHHIREGSTLEKSRRLFEEDYTKLWPLVEAEERTFISPNAMTTRAEQKKQKDRVR